MFLSEEQPFKYLSFSILISTKPFHFVLLPFHQCYIISEHCLYNGRAKISEICLQAKYICLPVFLLEDPSGPWGTVDQLTNIYWTPTVCQAGNSCGVVTAPRRKGQPYGDIVINSFHVICFPHILKRRYFCYPVCHPCCWLYVSLCLPREGKSRHYSR